MIKVAKDPLLLDLLLKKYSPDVVAKFCCCMSEVAKEQGCWSDMDWWDEAQIYVTNTLKQSNNETSNTEL